MCVCVCVCVHSVHRVYSDPLMIFIAYLYSGNLKGLMQVIPLDNSLVITPTISSSSPPPPAQQT